MNSIINKGDNKIITNTFSRGVKSYKKYILCFIFYVTLHLAQYDSKRVVIRLVKKKKPKNNKALELKRADGVNI